MPGSGACSSGGRRVGRGRVPCLEGTPKGGTEGAGCQLESGSRSLSVWSDGGTVSRTLSTMSRSLSPSPPSLSLSPVPRGAHAEFNSEPISFLPFLLVSLVCLFFVLFLEEVGFGGGHKGSHADKAGLLTVRDHSQSVRVTQVKWCCSGCSAKSRVYCTRRWRGGDLNLLWGIYGHVKNVVRRGDGGDDCDDGRR